MQIKLFGQRSHLGVGIFFSEFADVFKDIHYIGSKIKEIDPFDLERVQLAINQSNFDDINIWFWQDPTIRLVKGKNICWAIFESDVLPESYLTNLKNFADLIWVPSSWARTILIANGIDHRLIDVVPGGVNANHFHPYLRKHSNSKKKPPFKFLALGKYEERKGYRQLLEAFKQTFQNSSDVLLLIKADFHLKHQEKKDQLNELIKSFDLKNVKTYWGDWSQEMMVALYNFSDAFIYPSRAEGWGFPLIESIACGLPVSATYYSGQTEFLNPIKGKFLEIDYQLEKIRDDEFKSYWPNGTSDIGSWALPSIESISTNLVTIKEDYSNFAEMAIEASQTIRTQFSWERSVDSALKSMLTRDLLNLKYDVEG